MRSLLVLVLCVLGLGLTAETASALEIVLRPGEVDKLSGTNLQCVNDGVGVKCGTAILTSGGGIAFVPDTLYLSINEGYVGLYTNPSGGLGKPPLLPKNVAGGALPPTLTQPQRTPLPTFTPGATSSGGDYFRPFWESPSDLIIRHNVDAGGHTFIFGAKFSYADAHVYPNTDFVLLSEIDARFGHYTRGLAGQIDSTFEQPHIPPSVELNGIVTELVGEAVHLRFGLPKPLYSLATRSTTIIYKMQASMQWSDGKAVCGAGRPLSSDILALGRKEASPRFHHFVKTFNWKSLIGIRKDIQQLIGVCK